jgi:hypothetical protein
MPIKLILIICFIFTLNGAYALAFEENIQLNGEGQLDCRTDAQVAHDELAASGSQSYHRVVNLDTENKTASLKSIYSLNVSNGIKSNINSNNNRSSNVTEGKTKRDQYPASSSNELKSAANMIDSKALDYEYLPIYSRSFRVKNSLSGKFDVVYNNSEDLSRNQYGIMMIDPDSLVHRSFVTGADHFSANNSISFDKSKVITKYKMNGSGLLKGSVIVSDTMRRQRYLSETRIRDSNFTISSGLENEAKFGKKIEDRETLSKKVDDVAVGSKKEKEAGQTPDLNDRYAREIISNRTNANKSQVSLSFNPNEIQKSDTRKKLIQDDDKTKQSNGGLDATKAQIGAKAILSGDDSTQHNDSLNVTEAQTGAKAILSGDDSTQHNDSLNAAKAQTGVKAILSEDKTKQSSGNPNTKETETNGALRIGLLTDESLSGTIIPASAFGASINSTYLSPNAMLADSAWGMAYIGDYLPDDDKNVYKGPDFSVNLTNGMYVITKNKTGTKQRFLKIGSSDGQIKIRYTPPGVRFDIYEDVAG